MKFFVWLSLVFLMYSCVSTKNKRIESFEEKVTAFVEKGGQDTLRLQLADSDDLESDDLSEGLKSRIYHLANYLHDKEQLVLTIEAHERKVVGAKVASVVRANWMKTKFLLIQDIPGSQIIAKGYGATQLLNVVDVKAKENKRVDILLVKKK